MIAVSPALSHRLPADRCCNCDARTQLEGIDIDVPLNIVSLEAPHSALVFRPTFCRLCRRTARRRRPTWRERVLLGFIASFGFVFLLAWTREALALDLEPLFLLAAAVLAGALSAMYFDRLATPGSRDRTSFWAPVSVNYRAKEKSEGLLQHLAFDFSSRSYATEFLRLNSAAVTAGALAVTLAGKRL